jgi:hypothetical protein
MLVFLIPFQACVVAVLVVDPFSRFGLSHQEEMLELKDNISGKINYPLYKLIAFEANPSNIIILGDSRSNLLNATGFERLLHESVANMSYGGGTIQEIADTFWEICGTTKLKKVYIGINFDLYNGKRLRSRVPEAIAVKNSVIGYICSRDTMKATFLICAAKLFDKDIDLEKPPYSKQEFWEYSLSVSATNFYSAYSYPKHYYHELELIANYCDRNKIDLIFFIPPTHSDLQDMIAKFDLEDEANAFRADLRSLGDLYDFDYHNELTSSKDNYLDPFHPKKPIGTIVIEELVLKRHEHSVYSEKSSSVERIRP